MNLAAHIYTISFLESTDYEKEEEEEIKTVNEQEVEEAKTEGNQGKQICGYKFKNILIKKV